MCKKQDTANKDVDMAYDLRMGRIHIIRNKGLMNKSAEQKIKTFLPKL